MSWEFDLENTNPDQLEGGPGPSPGRYHAQVLSVDDSNPDKSMKVQCEVLAGEPPKQEGKTWLEFFSRTPDAAKRALLFACALKLTTAEELKRMKEAHQTPRIDFSLAVGRQFFCELQEEEYEGKKNVKAGFRLWSLDNPKAKGIPVNQGALRQAPASPMPADLPPNPSGDVSDLF